MNNIFRILTVLTAPLPVLLMAFYFLIIPSMEISAESEITESAEEIIPPKRNYLTDSGYAILGSVTSNLFLYINARHGNQPFAEINFESMWRNLSENHWFWEDGDRFLVNQFGHPYQGSTYFASARINGFNFYESILFAPLGALTWEVFLEPEPGINDLITTTIGGIALGEMLHRLFLEADSRSSLSAKIGGFLISPLSGFNKIYNRPVRESGGGNIYHLSVASGAEKSFAFFPEYEDQEDSWKYPGGHINTQVVYGDPFVQQSRTPYEHFEFYIGFTTNIDSYHAAIISDGYLFSINSKKTDRSSTSAGLSMHLDFFNATNDIIDNVGYGNLQFSSSAVGWTVKYQYCFSENSSLEFKAHAAFVMWGNSMYNSDSEIKDYWVDLKSSRSTFGMGENIKLYFTFSHYKAGKLELSALGYHIAAIPVTDNHSTGNVLFSHISFAYDFPLGAKLGIGAKATFWWLFGIYDSAPNVKRGLLSNCLYIRYAF